MHRFELKGQCAIVTGGAKGIGFATARAFSRAGADVAIVDINADAARDAAREIAATGGKSIALACDVTNAEQVEAAFDEAASALGGIDILVNNAGTAIRKTALELSLEQWDRVMDLNVKATFLASRTAVRHMLRRGGGSIVNLASIMGLSGGLYPNASYQASKGAVVNLTRALALEWASEKIRVNAVAPTYVRTDLTVPIFSDPIALERVMANTPLGVLPDVDDIALAILYLASPAARCVTGITLPVDSGYLAR
jgi:NAD(P)-dependent dehydrogenase (short-subunit alcohol dehydrogenase family)